MPLNINIQKIAHEAAQVSSWRRPDKIRETAKRLGITQKSIKDEIKRQQALRKTRAEAQETHQPTTIKQRSNSRKVKICIAEIRARSLDTITGFWDNLDQFSIYDQKPAERAWLCRAAYWYKYSNRFGSRYLEANYLCGVDRGQYWAVRVPSTITMVIEALEWLKPAAVRKAEAAGKWVRRQGDVWLVESRQTNMSLLPQSHTYTGKSVTHAQHSAVRISKRIAGVTAIPQKQLGSGGRRRAAD